MGTDAVRKSGGAGGWKGPRIYLNSRMRGSAAAAPQDSISALFLSPHESATRELLVGIEWDVRSTRRTGGKRGRKREAACAVALEADRGDSLCFPNEQLHGKIRFGRDGRVGCTNGN